jgi:ABC-2 type transport system ATP-binding protein
MDEAENLCDRLAIIDKGKMIASDSPHGLIARYAREVKVIFSTKDTVLPWLNEVQGVKNVTVTGLRVEVTGTGPLLALTAVALAQHGIIPADLRVEQPTLEDVFLKLTGKTAGE